MSENTNPNAPATGGDDIITGQFTPPTTPVDGQSYAAAVQAQQAAVKAAQDAQPIPTERPRPPAGEDLAALRAEVEQETAPADEGYPDDCVAVPLEGVGGQIGIVHVLNDMDWPSFANSSRHVGDYETWAAHCLAGDDYIRVWVRLAPTLRQVHAFIADYARLKGVDMGKSMKSNAILRTTAQR